MKLLKNEPATPARLLQLMKIKPHYKGYRPLKNAIEDVAGNEDLLHDVTKNLYPYLAESQDTNWKNAEFNMRRCITICWEQGGKETYCEIAGEDPKLAVKPRLRDFISTVAGYITRNKEEKD